MAGQFTKYFPEKIVGSVSLEWNPNPDRALLDLTVFKMNGQYIKYKNVESVTVSPRTHSHTAYVKYSSADSKAATDLYKITFRPSDRSHTLIALARRSSPHADAQRFEIPGVTDDRGIKIGGDGGPLTVTIGAKSGGGWGGNPVRRGRYTNIPSLSGIDAFPEPLNKVPTWVWVAGVLVGWGYLGARK